MVAMSMHVAPSLLMVRGCYNEWQQARDVDSQVCGPLLCRTQLAVLNDFVVLRYRIAAAKFSGQKCGAVWLEVF